MKLLFEFLPIVLFFIAFRVFDIFTATVIAMATSVLQITWLIYRKKRVETMQWISLGLILIFGGLTVLLHNEQFIKIKPTILYWSFALILVVGKLLLKKNLIEKIMGEQIKLKETSEVRVWNLLNLAWILFFTFLGGLNLYVAQSYSSDIWNTFKLSTFGILIIFVIIQGVWLTKHIQTEES
jgi:intracellular septation protein